MTGAIRSYLGASQNRLEHSVRINENTSENTQSAESVIRDTNMALEMMNHSKNRILEEASQSMLAQANQITEGIIRLLG